MFYPYFKLDGLNVFVVLSIGLFFILTIIYSLKFMQGKRQLLRYYSCVVITAVISILAALSNHLILLLVFWGFLGLTLYLLVNMGDDDAPAVAKKTFIIVGGSDALMLLGIGIIYQLSGTFQMDKISLSLVTGNWLLVTAYLCLAVASFAKAGAMPFHSWIPDCARHAPIPVTAFLPASLDKLLGIYLLARVSLNLFGMSAAMNTFLMLIGAFTIIAAVMMALVQHNAKRLLGYHAVSQVGYMVLGIGTGNPIGIAGGIFHMLNNTIYKSCLFLTAGNVEHRTKTAELDALGGLAKSMPITYISCLVASLAISGVPPFNGFVSKWMIYQGLVSQLQATGYRLQAITILCLAAAMFGSGLTLASFMKLIHATFLGQHLNTLKPKNLNEVPWTMWLPCIILAAFCILFGVFAFSIPLRFFIFPALSTYRLINLSSFPGVWCSGPATLLIIVGLFIGLLIFMLRGLRMSLRLDKEFVGGETAALMPEETAVSSTEFYNTIKEMTLLSRIYKKAEAGFFDLYEQGRRFVFSISGILRYLHNGVLPTYLVWCLLGMLGLFYIFYR